MRFANYLFVQRVGQHCILKKRVFGGVGRTRGNVLLTFYEICGLILNNEGKCGTVSAGQLTVDIAMDDDETLLGMCAICRMQNTVVG